VLSSSTSPRSRRSGTAADIMAPVLRAARAQTPVRDSQPQCPAGNAVVAVLPQPSMPPQATGLQPGPLGMALDDSRSGHAGPAATERSDDGNP